MEPDLRSAGAQRAGPNRPSAVHRDFMPRNLMVTEPGPGILDFQDAVRGPIADVASMLRDAFISWDEAQEIDWAVRFTGAAARRPACRWRPTSAVLAPARMDGPAAPPQVLGIFCRLKHRDGKPEVQRGICRASSPTRTRWRRHNGLGPLARLLEPLMGTDRIEAFY